MFSSVKKGLASQSSSAFEGSVFTATMPTPMRVRKKGWTFTSSSALLPEKLYELERFPLGRVVSNLT